MRADRLLSIVALLRQHGRMSATDLARRLEVTSRTIARDIDSLSLMDVPVYAERGRNGGYSILPGYRPGTTDLTADESTALLVGGSGVAGALGMDQAFGRAVRSMATALPEGHARQVGHLLDRIVVDPDGWGGAVRNPESLSTAFEAVQRECRVRVDYNALSSGRGGRRTLDPWGLVLAGSTWYLIAAHRGHPHTYRLSRMSSVHLLDQQARRPSGLDLQQVWREIRAGWNARESTAIRLRVRADQLDLTIRSLQIALVQQPIVTDIDDAHVLLDAEVHSLRGVVGVLLGFGTWVEALGPPELRALMRTTALQALSMYSD